MKRKNILVPILILLSLAIWGNNAYRIFLGITQSADEEVEPVTDKSQNGTGFSDSTSMATPVFIYNDTIRDPFQPAFWNPEPIKAKPVKEIIPQSMKIISGPPRLRFCGVVKDSRGSLAIVEGPDSNTNLVREKESIAGVIILSIHSDHLECLFEKTKFRLELAP